ncbi:PorP/SprF family type IX secretion system membrane protein [Zobellia barbeyronii]|uniref:PorP/SprF family type IX secretion system membrane protein n=1 Tax=Zobellia barbeyronii TaxID=2748009 RepID=A0ABS5WBF2_9FLAO|nr:PorP/SprF family type IX secretion system membrane protein [Zobellia barbeyronii]MBT2160301.1 PorP/SprF family type IX secretion system membrane protein [Zobellia barbeyronii]
MKFVKYIALTLLAALTFGSVQAQEDDPVLLYSPASQNLLKFNRFLINPTFSTVQEDKSYINLLHRNQSVQFKDNDQTYFLSYSGRIGDKSGLGLSLYTQSVGAVSNIGVLANYAYGIKLSDKSNFTFGGNLAYYSTGLDQNSIDVIDLNDYSLTGTEDSNVLSFQPGFNISYGNIDFGVFAENLFDYNLKTSKSLTEFGDKTYSSHLQYTHHFDNNEGIMEGSRLMPIARVRMNGQNRLAAGDESQDMTYGGAVILDLPKLGWLQGGYDSFYGASAGAGFNINKRLSLGYTMEKGFGTNFDNFGVTHEISFAFSFTPNLTEDRVMLEDDYEDSLVDNEEVDKNDLVDNEEIEELKRKLAENDAIIQELMFRQDSLESNRQKDLENRFNMVMSMVRNETNGERPDLEDRAQSLFMGSNDRPAIASNDTQNSTGIPNSTLTANTSNNGTPTSKTPNNNISNNSTPTTTLASNNTTQSRPTIAKDKVQSNTTTNSRTNSGTTSAVADRSDVKSRKFKNLEGVKDGYYVVANVYKGGQYMDKFMNKLNNDGFSSDYIDNPSNGLKYVYLERYDTWEEAVAAHNSGMNGAYDGAMWIMDVDNRYSNEAYASNVDKLKEKSAKYDTDVLRTNAVVKDQMVSNELDPKTHKIDGIGSGYYIIANVFANPKNANRFVKLLNSYGLSASYFINPDNNWRYVYLKRHQSWNNALLSYYTNLNDAYNDKMWIMRVKPNLLA